VSNFETTFYILAAVVVGFLLARWSLDQSLKKEIKRLREEVELLKTQNDVQAQKLSDSKESQEALTIIVRDSITDNERLKDELRKLRERMLSAGISPEASAVGGQATGRAGANLHLDSGGGDITIGDVSGRDQEKESGPPPRL